ncbi:hypothetical protein PR048_033485 [Dryococelus australis]|uniref:Uncharacterized protein n=1 Tax=Dryococelus australis TaxID=614101 RepID=A0ABQ9G387_9NEOP|nr:hypothetical protein PR048_033485 [Dryococelus australis]
MRVVDCWWLFQLKTKLLYSWVADLLEQNASLVDTVSELEKVAVERVQLLEEKLRKSSSSVHQYMTKIQVADGHTSLSLRSLVSRLELDIGSLLVLIHRARTEGCWDIGGLVFHEVSYWDIFSSAPPPPSSPRKDEATETPKNDMELETLKAEVEFWRTRAKKAEAEAQQMQMSRETGRPGDIGALQQELEEARRLATERAEEIQALRNKIDVAEQHGKDVQAALAAEVAEKHDQVVQLRQRLNLMENDLQLSNMQTHFRDEIIKGMRKEVKRFKSQVSARGLGNCINSLRVFSECSHTPRHCILLMP